VRTTVKRPELRGRKERFAKNCRIFVTVLFIIEFLSLWFNDSTRLATALGLVTAGVAFDEAKIGIASTTFDIAGLPPVQIQIAGMPADYASGVKQQ